MPISIRNRKRGRDDSDDDTGNNDSAPHQIKVPRHHHIYTSSTPPVPQHFLQHPLCLREMFQITQEHLFNHKGEDACRQSLTKARASVEEQIRKGKVDVQNAPWKQIPSTLPRLLKIFELKPSIQSRVCCPFCCALYCFADPAQPDVSPVQICNHLRFTSKASTLQHAQPCRSPLYHQPTGTNVQKPSRIFYYQSLQSWLGKMLTFCTFEAALDAPLNHTSPPNHQMDNIWDSSLWKTFEKSGSTFTATSGNLVFGL